MPKDTPALRRPTFAERLRVEARASTSVNLIHDEWRDLDQELSEDGPAMEAAFREATGPTTHPSGAAVAPLEALAIGVVSGRGRLEFADGTFSRLFPRAAQDGLSSLIARAHAEGSALGLVETADGEVLAGWAGQAEPAQRWPLSEAALQALAAKDRLAVVVFAPSQSSALSARAAAAFDLTPAEARLAEALLFSPSLEIAAASIGIGRATARDTLRRIMARAGARRLPALLSRLTELMGSGHVDGPADEVILVQVFGLAPSEARCAALIAAGETAKQAAETLGLSPETVKGYIKSVLAKTGLARAKDLSRLLVEARELSVLASVRDPVFESAKTAGRLRLVSAPDERQIAFIDYGPRSGRPALIFHGYAAGRTLPPQMVRELQTAGFRPIVPQRPGFGLTTPASAGQYLACAADDLALLIQTLGADDAVMLARDGGAAVALEFAARHPNLPCRVAMLNPRTPKAHAIERTGLLAVVARRLLGNPALVHPVVELMRRQADRTTIERQLRATCAMAQADRDVLENSETVDGLVRDIQALVSRSYQGFADENFIYAADWSPPPVDHGSWRVLRSGALAKDEPDAPWRGLPGLVIETIPEAGFLAQFSHPKALVAALSAL